MSIDQFIMTSDVAYFILLQRTDYQQAAFNNMVQKFRRLRLYRNYFLKIEAMVRKNFIAKLYYDDIKTEFNDIKNHLPSELGDILDIGCGMGGINIFLNNVHSNANGSFFTVLDKNGTSEIYYGFHEKAAFYNSLELTYKFLTLNGVQREKFRCIDIVRNKFPSDIQYNLIISLISWGFHYPVDIYLNEAYASLRNDGVIILDIRQNTNGEEQIKKMFKEIEIIKDYGTFKRIKALKY